jgi:uncharacterized protein
MTNWNLALSSWIVRNLGCRPSGLSLRAWALGACAAFSMLLVGPAFGQSGDLRSGKLNPFPKDDVYRLHFVGDWLMDGLQPALKDALKTIPRVQMQSGVLEIQSLRRSSWDRGVSSVRTAAKSTPIDMAVVMFGVEEIGSVFSPGQRKRRFGSEEWLKQYGRRIDSLMKALKSSNGAVYWVGLPVVRRRDRSESYQIINTIIRERAYANSITYIDTYSRFQSDNGGFDRYGPDLDGTIKLMRRRDGVYFTGIGNANIAHLVVQMIRRDLSVVKSERVVTLAGGETEQSSIRRLTAPEQSKSPPYSANARSRQKKRTGRAASQTRFGRQEADDGKFVLQTMVGRKPTKVVLKLPRPTLSAAIMSLVTRNQSKNKSTSFGDNAVQVIDGGVPLLSTVTPADRNSLALLRRRLSPTQSVFFKVWGKGERLDPKPGRADDMQWPRPDPKPVQHVTAKPEDIIRKRRYRDPNLPPLPVQNPFQ